MESKAVFFFVAQLEPVFSAFLPMSIFKRVIARWQQKNWHGGGEMDNCPKWKRANIGGTRFPLFSWLREEEYGFRNWTFQISNHNLRLTGLMLLPIRMVFQEPRLFPPKIWRTHVDLVPFIFWISKTQSSFGYCWWFRTPASKPPGMYKTLS